MKEIIITGASGMVGGIVLRECLDSPEIGKVVSLVRRASGISHAKLAEIMVDDFCDYSTHEEHFKGIDIAYFCIGVYTGAVPRDEFRKITVDYTKAFADTLKKNSPQASFCFLSGMVTYENKDIRKIKV